ncbi:sucrase-isomaltase, intestinal-like isoform X2 [Lineus longissimus]|uniref:sucrase-isomaltase, intestinal-like isoform X2 n=1 Tax=Lineus longissimus TaxID=88925 RepID=UPI00315D6E7A
MMETAWVVLLLCLAVGAEADNACLNVPESSRRDCQPGFMTANPEINKQDCASRRCHWCESRSPGVPWCFLPLEDQCPLLPAERKDCLAGRIATKELCQNKLCTWCPSILANTPWCYSSVLPGGEYCPSEIQEQDRVECFPIHQNPSKDGCVARGCFYCPTSRPNTPWCFLDSRGWPSQIIPEVERIDCMRNGGDVVPSDCTIKGCRYRQNSIGAPWCYIPREQGYVMTKQPLSVERGWRIHLRRNSTMTLYGDVMYDVVVDVEFQTDERLRVKISDPHRSRFEVPLPINRENLGQPINPLYDITFSNEPAFSFKVTRKSTGTVVFDTSIGGLVLEDQFLQIATRLPSWNVYGFGEHQHTSFRHDLNWKTWGMFSRDQPPSDNGNLYGVQPYYTVLENDGNAHSVLFLNSAAQDVTLMPAPALSYRTIGGILDLYIFMGPTPENVVQQFTQAVGRPFMPPYWSLGFSLAKFGYHTLDNMKKTIDKMREYDIPHDYQFGDIDYMDRNLDFTYSHDRWAGLPSYVNQLKENGTRFIIILDPAIANGIPNYRPFELGQQQDVWVKYADGKTPVEGKVWPPTPVYYPDYTKPITTDWWVTLCREFHNVIDFDGLWIDMNEPSNFVWGSTTGCSDNKINHPPYWPNIWGPKLYYKTLCPDHKHFIGNHNEVHSLYGWSQAEPTMKAARAATGKRSIVLSRSMFPGAGKFAAHWLGDNWSYWSNIKYSITGLFEANMFGIPFVGADICGFIRNADYEMCLRWQQIGAFYPFSRNHNLGYENRDQEPTVWGDDFARISRDKLHIRYTLLPYLYTLFHYAHTVGSTVVRPFLNEFPLDPATHTIDRQFLWGPSFLISPVLDYGARSVNAYFPDARWYSYYDGKEVTVRKQWQQQNAPLDFIPLHVRGGYIIPTQLPSRSTKYSRSNPMGLIVAIDDNGKAKGDLFWDDGETIDSFENGAYFLAQFSYDRGSLRSTIVHSNYDGAKTLKMNSMRIMGVASTTWVKVNDNNHGDFTFNSNTKELSINNIGANMGVDFSITHG